MKNSYPYQFENTKDFDTAMDKYGWLIYEDVISPGLVDIINLGFAKAYRLRRTIQKKNGIEEDMKGTLHHLLEPDNFGFTFISQLFCDAQIRHFLQGNYILNGINGVINLKHATPYVQNVHRDMRSFTAPLKLMIQMIVLLDDFTLDNGATFFLSGSHKTPAKPNELKFFGKADRAVARKGSIILFDSLLWHAAGKNYTDDPRRALTLSFTVPYVKQQLDYPRFLGYEAGENFSEELRQVIGYNARVPANLYEFYQPLQRRMYQSGQG
ncbi:phytanoyl-CoA dioxygenase family protein [Pedobacter gandavensis]|uniref:phytanoyl-CoA dioxygenase family protein n=1 Tax=Pedobacter gandavensis TaxID=2679963 RepID=UPI00292D85A9|nr:phytanoyl-CoA dioxygenase family protein [Pedobacter gandavensis]